MNVADIISRVEPENLRKTVFYLCRDPLPFRTVLYHRPWHEKNSLAEAGDFIIGEMRKLGLEVNIIPTRVRPFRCNPSNPLHHWYDSPRESDPWYDADIIEVVIPGTETPEEISISIAAEMIMVRAEHNEAAAAARHAEGMGKIHE